MKTSNIILLILVLAALAVLVWRSGREDEGDASSAEPEVSVPEGQVLERNTEALEVFRRAFWCQPGEGDRIVHGERREWSDHSGVARWQWFLEVEPSDRLRRELLETNRFALKQVASGLVPFLEQPSWFPARITDYEVLSAGGGEMMILHRRGEGRFFATGSGGGFVRATDVPEAPSASRERTVAGRLPNHPPPTEP